MIWIKHNNREFNVRWVHNPEETLTVYHLLGDRVLVTEAKGTSTCEIWEDGDIIASGRSYCSLEDQFTKEMGRQVSLRKAVKNLDRGIAGAIIFGYFNRKKHD